MGARNADLARRRRRHVGQRRARSHRRRGARRGLDDPAGRRRRGPFHNALRSGAARSQPARWPRHGFPAYHPPGQRHDARHHPYRHGPAQYSHRGAQRRRRRLPGQAVRPQRADGPDRRGGSPLWRQSQSPDHHRAAHDQPGTAQRAVGRPLPGPDGARMDGAREAHPTSGPPRLQVPARGCPVRLRCRSGEQRRRSLYQPPAQEDRQPPDPHRARPRLPYRRRMTRPRSLTRWLILALTAGAVALWLLAASLAANSLRLSLNEAFDGGLQETAERLLPLALDGFRDEGDEHHEARDAHEIPLYSDAASEYIVYQMRLPTGEILLRSHDAPATPFDAPLTTGFADSGPWRIYTVGSSGHDIFIQVAEATAHRSQSLIGSILALLWPIALLIPLSALGIYIAVRNGLRPVRVLSAEISARHATNLTPLNVANLPLELRPIGDAVD